MLIIFSVSTVMLGMVNSVERIEIWMGIRITTYYVLNIIVFKWVNTEIILTSSCACRVRIVLTVFVYVIHRSFEIWENRPICMGLCISFSVPKSGIFNTFHYKWFLWIFHYRSWIGSLIILFIYWLIIYNVYIISNYFLSNRFPLSTFIY